MGRGDLRFAPIPVHPDLHHTQKPIPTLLALTNALLDQLALLVDLVQVFAAACVADLSMLVRDHQIILSRIISIGYPRTLDLLRPQDGGSQSRDGLREDLPRL